MSAHRDIGLWLIALLVCVALPQSATTAQDEQKGTITGFVRTMRGEPVGGATVRVLHAGEEGPKATTGADGAYTLANVPPGKCDLEATKDGFQPAQKKNVVVTAGKTTKMNFGLHEAGAPGLIKCTVVDQEGKPVRGAKAIVRKGPSRQGDVVQSQAEGYLVIDRLEPGTYDIEFMMPGVGAKVEEGVEIKPGQTVTGTIKLDPSLAPPTTGTLEFKLSLPDGAPAAKAPLYVFQPGTKNRFKGESDAQGVATFADLEAGEYAFQARIAKHKRIFRKGVKVEAAETVTIELKFQPSK